MHVRSCLDRLDVSEYVIDKTDHVEPHGQREVGLQRPGRAGKRQQEAEHDRHPGDAPDVVVSPVRELVLRVYVACVERNLQRKQRNCKSLFAFATSGVIWTR